MPKTSCNLRRREYVVYHSVKYVMHNVYNFFTLFEVKSNPYCSNAFSYPRILFPHIITSIIIAMYRPIMQAASAILEGVFVVQPWTIVGSNGIATGDHKTRIMPANPKILDKKKQCSFRRCNSHTRYKT